MKWLILCGLMVFGLGLLTGCKAKYKDISDDPEYRHLLNNKYETLSKLNVYGVNAYGNPDNDSIDLYVVVNFGYDGHEVLSRIFLDKDTEFVILRVKSCTNCLFQKLIKYEIAILSKSPIRDITQPIYLSDNQNNMAIEGSDGRVDLDPSMFSKLKGDASL
tara:strand:+ start:494 stop:976 length:483 start_codon:yes stop_codon:yes gene_type:complete